MLGNPEWKECSIYDDDYMNEEEKELSPLVDDYINEEYLNNSED